MTGLHSRAMTSPDGKIRIPINEDAGETGPDRGIPPGVQGRGHPARGAAARRDLYESIETLLERGLEFMPAPNEVYYDADRQAAAEPRRTAGAAASERHPDRRRGRRRRRLHQGAAPALRQDRDRPDLLRVHPAQGRRRLRRGQLQGAVRIHRGRPDPARRAQVRRSREADDTIRKAGSPGLFRGVRGESSDIEPRVITGSGRKCMAEGLARALYPAFRAGESPCP